jgi:hypothetical protein
MKALYYTHCEFLLLILIAFLLCLLNTYALRLNV